MERDSGEESFSVRAKEEPIDRQRMKEKAIYGVHEGR